MTTTRRQFLQATALAAVALPLGACAAGATGEHRRQGGIRPTATASRRWPDRSATADGSRVFDLTARAGRREFLPGRVTDTWGFNGDYLGPTLRAARGEQVTINVHNALPETTSVHWHGMHLPARDDGGPHQPIEPGQTWSPSWTHRPAGHHALVPPASARTHREARIPRAGRHVRPRRRARKPRSICRRTYGVDDIPLIVAGQAIPSTTATSTSPTTDPPACSATRCSSTARSPRISGRDRGSCGCACSTRPRRASTRSASPTTAVLADRHRRWAAGTALRDATNPALAGRACRDRRGDAPSRTRRAALLPTRPRHRPRDMTTEVGGDDSFDVVELRAAASLTSRPAPLPASLVDVARLDPADAVR